MPRSPAGNEKNLVGIIRFGSRKSYKVTVQLEPSRLHGLADTPHVSVLIAIQSSCCGRIEGVDVENRTSPAAPPQDHQRCVSFSRIIHTNDQRDQMPSSSKRHNPYAAAQPR